MSDFNYHIKLDGQEFRFEADEDLTLAEVATIYAIPLLKNEEQAFLVSVSKNGVSWDEYEITKQVSYKAEKL